MARPPKQTGYAMDNRWREKLRISNILTRLDQAAAGEIEMSQTSLAAAKLLLSKVIPDLTRTTVGGDPESPLQVNVNLSLTDKELIERYRKWKK